MSIKCAQVMSQTKEINWEGIPLLTEDALHEKLAEENWSSISDFLKKHSSAAQERYSILSSDFNLDFEDFKVQQLLLVIKVGPTLATSNIFGVKLVAPCSCAVSQLILKVPGLNPGQVSELFYCLS